MICHMGNHWGFYNSVLYCCLSSTFCMTKFQGCDFYHLLISTTVKLWSLWDDANQRWENYWIMLLQLWWVIATWMIMIVLKGIYKLKFLVKAFSLSVILDSLHFKHQPLVRFVCWIIPCWVIAYRVISKSTVSIFFFTWDCLFFFYETEKFNIQYWLLKCTITRRTIQYPWKLRSSLKVLNHVHVYPFIPPHIYDMRWAVSTIPLLVIKQKA